MCWGSIWNKRRGPLGGWNWWSWILRTRSRIISDRRKKRSKYPDHRATTKRKSTNASSTISRISHNSWKSTKRLSTKISTAENHLYKHNLLNNNINGSSYKPKSSNYNKNLRKKNPSSSPHSLASSPPNIKFHKLIKLSSKKNPNFKTEKNTSLYYKHKKINRTRNFSKSKHKLTNYKKLKLNKLPLWPKTNFPTTSFPLI